MLHREVHPAPAGPHLGSILVYTTHTRGATSTRSIALYTSIERFCCGTVQPLQCLNIALYTSIVQHALYTSIHSMHIQHQPQCVLCVLSQCFQ